VPVYPDLAELYPEVAAAGGLAAALRAAAARQGLALVVAESEALDRALVPTSLPHRQDLVVSAARVARWWSVAGRQQEQELSLFQPPIDLG